MIVDNINAMIKMGGAIGTSTIALATVVSTPSMEIVDKIVNAGAAIGALIGFGLDLDGKGVQEGYSRKEVVECMLFQNAKYIKIKTTIEAGFKDVQGAAGKALDSVSHK